MNVSLFKSESDRQLWIRLNAKYLQWFQKTRNKHDCPFDGPNPNDYGHCMGVSRNQLEFDEASGKLRFTLIELSTLDMEDLNRLAMEQLRQFIKESFEQE